MLLSAMMILFSMALTGCSGKECPKPVYPKLEAIDRIPKIEITVNNGTLDRNGTLNVFKTIKALRVSEHYYYTLISDYRGKFNQ